MSQKIRYDIAYHLGISVITYTLHVWAFRMIVINKRDVAPAAPITDEESSDWRLEPVLDLAIHNGTVFQVRVVKCRRGESGDGGVHSILGIEHYAGDV